MHHDISPWEQQQATPNVTSSPATSTSHEYPTTPSHSAIPILATLTPVTVTATALTQSTATSLLSHPSPSLLSPDSPAVFTRNNNDFHNLWPRALVLDILTDWADQVYPLAPLLHRQTFLHRFLTREDEHSPVFCALVLSTCAVTISTLRRLSYQKYPNVTVLQCLDAIEQGSMLHPRKYTLDWCISCYNVASSFHALDGQEELRQYQMIKDAIAGAQWLLFCDPGRDAMSLHDREILRRLFWLMTMWQL